MRKKVKLLLGLVVTNGGRTAQQWARTCVIDIGSG